MRLGLFVAILLGTLFTAALFAVPVAPAEAGIIPCGLNVDDPAQPGDQTMRCTICHLILLIQNIITFLRNIMTAIAIAVIVAMAIVYITSAGDEGRMRFAKGGIVATLIGFTIILLAWVIVNFILNLPVFSTNTGLVRSGGAWSSFTCNLTPALGTPIR